MSYSAQLVADYFLTHAQNPLTAMHMIKLTYIAHGYTLAITKKPLINARIEAWKYGPVIPALYHSYKGYRGDIIDKLNYCGTTLADQKISDRRQFIDGLFGSATIDILEQITKHFSRLDALELSSLTHTEGTPWHQCYRADQLFTLIPNEVIQKFYEEKMNDDRIKGY